MRQSLWALTIEQVQRIAGTDRAAQASVALWAFLHGAVGLEAAQVFGDSKPASGLEFGHRRVVNRLSRCEDSQRGTGEVSAKETASRQALASCLAPRPPAGPVRTFARTWANEPAPRKGKTECQIASPL